MFYEPPIPQFAAFPSLQYLAVVQAETFSSVVSFDKP